MDSWEKIEAAAERFDWAQPVGSDWNPCFALMEDGRFCGRAQRWAGHGPDHAHVSLAALVRALRERDEKRWEIVREVEGDIRTHAETYDQAAMSRTTYSEFWFGEADRLRAAREGK